MKLFLLVYLCALLLFDVVNPNQGNGGGNNNNSNGNGNNNSNGNGNNNSNGNGNNNGNGNGNSGGSTTTDNDSGYTIAEQYSTSKPHPYLPVFATDDTSCDTHVVDFTSNGVDRLIIVGTTLSNKYIDGSSGCVDTPTSNPDLHGVPFIAMRAQASTITEWTKFLPHNFTYMGSLEPYNLVKQVVAVRYSAIYGLDSGASAAPAYKTPLFAVFVKTYSTSSVDPEFSSFVLVMHQDDGSIKKVISAQSYHWDLSGRHHPFVFQINSASADATVADNIWFYTTEKSETGVVMGDLSTGNLEKRSNSASTTFGLATALVFHDESLYVGGAYVKNYASL